MEFLNYKTQGTGKPLILLHGLFGSLNNLGSIARAFAPHYQVVQIDLPNHGLSPRASQMDYLFQAAQVKALLEHLQLTDITLIGHSMGGKVAMMFSLLYPSLVDKLVVLDIAPCAYPQQHSLIFAALNATLTGKIASRSQAEQTLNRYLGQPAITAFLLSSLFRAEDGSMHWRFAIRQLEQHYQEIAGWPAHQLAPFTQPVLFIKGQLSDYILPAHKRAIASQFPAAQARIIANTGHWLHSEKPNSVNRFIHSFLANESSNHAG